MSKKRKLAAIHPGEILYEEYMVPNGLNARKLAIALHTDAPRINDIIRGRRGITADTALRLSAFFAGTTPAFWLGLQASYDVRVTRDKIANRTRQIRAIAS